MKFAINELSIESPCENVTEARARVRLLIHTLRALDKLEVASRFVAPKRFRQCILGPSYVVEQWVRDQEAASKDERNFFLAKLTRSPYSEDVWTELARDTSCECTHLTRDAIGLGIAYLSGGAAVSFDAMPWNESDEVDIDVTCFTCDDIVHDVVEVCSISTPSQVESRKQWITAKHKRAWDGKSGAELWNSKEERFPDLIFCNSVGEFLSAMGQGDHRLSHILRHFDAINKAAKEWNGGPFTPQGINWSNESIPTMQHNRFGPMRTLECPDGKLRVFSPHSKLIGLNLRIHFVGEESGERRRVYIGYVGPHLPTIDNTT